jgi:hypothetical protein
LTKLFQINYLIYNFNKQFIIKALITKKIVMKKQMRYSGLLMILFLFSGLFSCERLTELYRLKDTVGTKTVKGPDKGRGDLPGDPCGEPVIIRLLSTDNLAYSPGNVIVTNNNQYLTVKLEVTEGDWNIDMIYIQVGPLDLVPLDEAATYPAFWEFDYQYSDMPVASYTFQLSLAELDDCVNILAQVRLTNSEDIKMITWTEGVNPGWTEGPFYTYYCVERCH